MLVGFISFSATFRVKRIGKEVVGSEEKRAEVLEARRLRRAVTDLTKRKRLGRGQFEEYAEPVLLPEELTGSLRRIKPQGSILQGMLVGRPFAISGYLTCLVGFRACQESPEEEHSSSGG